MENTWKDTSEAIYIMNDLYNSISYPNLPLEESAKHFHGQNILHKAICWLLGGTKAQQMRFAGLASSAQSSIPESDYTEHDFPENIPTNPKLILLKERRNFNETKRKN